MSGKKPDLRGAGRLFVVSGARKGHERLFYVKTGKHDAIHQKTADCFLAEDSVYNRNQQSEGSRNGIDFRADYRTDEGQTPLPVFHPP